MTHAGSAPGSSECQWLQAFEDAIKFRHARTAEPCSDCDASPERCDDHGRDLGLITEYQRTARQITQAAPYAAGSDTFKLSAGDQGTVEFTDGLGTIHIQWDNGRRAGIITQDAALIRDISGPGFP